MPLSREEVQHIASLCRIGMTEEDLEPLPEQLSQVLELFQTLQQAQTEDVSPTGHSVSPGTVMRAAEAGPSAPMEEVLSNAPNRQDDLIRVKVVLEE